MLPLTKVLAGTAIAAAAMMAAAPAGAQYYPYGNGYGSGPAMGNAPGYGYGYGGYNGSQSPMVSQCTAAVQARLSGNGYGGGYGYQGYSNGGGRVLGISRVDPRSDGGFTVRGVAASGAYGYGGNQQPDLTFRCRTDFRGTVTDVSIQPAQRTYNSYGATPYGYAQPYSQSPYDQGQYNQSPSDQAPYDQGQYNQDPNDQGSYYQDQSNTGPYGYSRY